MNTVEEITAAIRALSFEDRRELMSRLPEIMPEAGEDPEWDRMILDPRPRPSLSALGDEIEAELQRNPRAFREMTDAEFDGNW